MPLGEKMIWDFLLHKIGNPYGTAGLMGNLCAESALDPTKLERTAEKKLGVSSAEYTARVDDGRYDAERFAHDGAGYGLAQWTYHARKAALLTYAKECGVSIGSLAMQLEYLWKELQGYKTVLKVLRAAVSVREASDIVMTRYEKPKNQSESARSKRQRYGQKYFDAYACKGVWEMYNPQAVIDAALNEVGYLEKATIAQLDDKTANAGSKNYTKYARDLYAAQYFNGNKQGAAWCAVFVAWCFYKAFGKNAALTLLCQPTRDNCGAGCGYIVRYFKAKKQWHTSNPQPGDVIVFYDTKMSGFQHTGLVYAVDSDYVYTVEGNTSSESGVIPNGGAVARKKYRHSYARIAGYGRPNWGMSISGGTSGSAGGGNDSADSSGESAAGAGKQVVVTASSVNIRTGNGKQYTRLTAVPQGTALDWVATAANGWHAVIYKKQVAWLDGQFAQIRG